MTEVVDVVDVTDSGSVVSIVKGDRDGWKNIDSFGCLFSCLRAFGAVSELAVDDSSCRYNPAMVCQQV